MSNRRTVDRGVFLRILLYAACTILVVVLLCIFVFKPYDIFRYVTDSDTNVPVVTTASVTDTSDQLRRFVTRFYQYGLQRAPSDDELEQWVTDIENGESIDEVVKYFFLSEELTNPTVSNEEYIARLYRCMFGRDPDASGYDNWVSELDNGMPRRTLVDTLLESEEWANYCNSLEI